MISPPADRVSHHHRYYTRRLRHHLPHLPSCAQSQTHRTLPRLRPKTDMQIDDVTDGPLEAHNDTVEETGLATAAVAVLVRYDIPAD